MNALFSGLLPGDHANWVPTSTGESGATVLRDTKGARFAKLVSAEHADELAGERDRIVWLEEAGISVGAVLDWRSNDDGVCLVTRAVAGVQADQLSSDALWQAWPSIISLVNRLHAIDATRCPFDRGLAVMMPLARTTVADDRVQTEFLPAELKQTPPTQLLRYLEEQAPRRVRQENEQSVVCHGDLCLPNIFVNPHTQQVSGVIDLGRLGRADPYADIALLLTNAHETWPNAHTARRADCAFADQYGIDLDSERQRFYLLLDPLTWPAERPGKSGRFL